MTFGVDGCRLLLVVESDEPVGQLVLPPLFPTQLFPTLVAGLPSLPPQDIAVLEYSDTMADSLY